MVMSTGRRLGVLEQLCRNESSSRSSYRKIVNERGGRKTTLQIGRLDFSLSLIKINLFGEQVFV